MPPEPETRRRELAGTPIGGRFAAELGSRSTVTLNETPASPPAYTEVACSTCGEMTKRRSGRCRRCDRADNTTPSARGEPRTAKSGLQLDRTRRPVNVDDIVQCSFGYVPDVRADGVFRQCKNAVVRPAEHCHQHGGDTSTSLARSIAKATAEAGRGECYPVAAEYWEQANVRLEAVYGQLNELLAVDTSAFAKAIATWRAQQARHSTQRLSAGNQMLLMVQYYRDGVAGGLGSEEAFATAMERLSEPTMTAKAWQAIGRRPHGRGAVVTYFKPRGAATGGCPASC